MCEREWLRWHCVCVCAQTCTFSTHARHQTQSAASSQTFSVYRGNHYSINVAASALMRRECTCWHTQTRLSEERERGLVWGAHGRGRRLGTFSQKWRFSALLFSENRTEHREHCLPFHKRSAPFPPKAGTRHVNKMMTHKGNLAAVWLRLQCWDNCCNHRCLTGPVSF